MENRKPQAALVIMGVLARTNNVAAARKALAPIAEIKPTKERPGNLDLKAKGYLAAALVRTGQDNAALALAADFEPPGQKAYIYHWVALAQARAGRKEAAKLNFDKAIELLTGADNKQTPTGPAMYNLAGALALAGDFKTALKIAEKGTESGFTWAVIANAQAESGDFEGARKTAAAYEKTYWPQYAQTCQEIRLCAGEGGSGCSGAGLGRQSERSAPQCVYLGGSRRGTFSSSR